MAASNALNCQFAATESKFDKIGEEVVDDMMVSFLAARRPPPAARGGSIWWIMRLVLEDLRIFKTHFRFPLLFSLAFGD